MIALDTATGERLDSHQILARIVDEVRGELGDVHELNRAADHRPRSVRLHPATARHDRRRCSNERKWTVEHLLQAHGWDFERAVFVKDMAKLRKEPLSARWASTAC